MLNEKQLELLKNQMTVVLSTSDKNNQPRSIFVEVNKIEDNSIIITDNHLNKSLENIKNNDKVFILAYANDYNYVIYITGNAIYHENDSLFEYVKNNPANEGYAPKGAIEIKITNVEELLNV